jgi:membrane-associated protease RseP (regulator of RpoE activity)
MPTDDRSPSDPGDPRERVAPATSDAAANRERGSNAPPAPLRWKANLALFLVTVASVFLAGTVWSEAAPAEGGLLGVLKTLPRGWPFAVPLLSILLVHEFGHYFAARAHRVEASLPFFIPMPVLSPFGTMGAVISMKNRIKSRNALLDIGASGPLAGLAVALPVLIIGLMRSEVKPITGPGLQEGRSLLYAALKWIALGPIPPGHDVFLGPVAMAGWVGMLVTMLNLLPVGQLDGGHIAYALLGPRQNRLSRLVHQLLFVVVAYNLARFLPGAIAAGGSDAVEQAIANSTFWLIWYVMIHVLRFAGGRDHPPTEPGELSPVRKAIGIVSLLFFVLLFMPTPWGVY